MHVFRRVKTCPSTLDNTCYIVTKAETSTKFRLVFDQVPQKCSFDQDKKTFPEEGL